MTSDEYVKTLDICGQKVEVGLDDYGQCYFAEWDDAEGHHEEGLGTYNFEYVEYLYTMFDSRYKALLRKRTFGEEMSKEEEAKYEEYQELFRHIQDN